jgi:hopanoid biosynthesis associated protein HpnK
VSRERRRLLVVNGDDFGLTAGVNAGIVAAHANGILTSASLFANALETGAAIDLAHRTPTLGVGCHLTLVDGVPMLPASRLPTLAPDGRFMPTWAGFIGAAWRRRIQLAEIERELEAQVDRLRSAGIALTHLDGHKHVHAYPPVFAIVVRLARRFGIPVVRVPWERRPARVVVQHLFHRHARRQAIENLALTPWAGQDRRLLVAHGLTPAPEFVGRTLTGLLTAATLHALLARLPPGAHELMVHPGYLDAALARVRTRLRAQRAAELSLLIDPSTIAAIRRAGIVLARHDGAVHSPEHSDVS